MCECTTHSYSWDSWDVARSSTLWLVKNKTSRHFGISNISFLTYWKPSPTPACLLIKPLCDSKSTILLKYVSLSLTVDHTFKIKKDTSEAQSIDLSSISKYIGVLLNERAPHPDPLFKILGRDIWSNHGIEHNTCLYLMLSINLEDTDKWVTYQLTHWSSSWYHFLYYRTFQRICDPADNLNITTSFFAHLFYLDFTRDQGNVKARFLQLQLLVLVSSSFILYAPSLIKYFFSYIKQFSPLHNQ